MESSCGCFTLAGLHWILLSLGTIASLIADCYFDLLLDLSIIELNASSIGQCFFEHRYDILKLSDAGCL